MVEMDAGERRSNLAPIWQGIVYFLALIGAGLIVSHAFPRYTYNLDYGGYISLVRTSWWGISEQRFLIRLQHFDDWKQGRRYRALNGQDEFDWFIQSRKGEWFPMEFGNAWE